MKPYHHEQGVTLIETMIALLIAMIGIFGLGNLVFQASATNKNQGTETTRGVVYAQDKMEKLLSLGAYKLPGASTPNYTDCNNDPAGATPPPAYCNSSNINDSGWATGLWHGGYVAPTSAQLVFACGSLPSASQGYIDYLDINGVQLPQSGTPPVPTPGACSSVPMTSVAYVRQWQITDLTPTGTGPVIKQVTVAVFSLAAINAAGGKPVVLLSSYLENPN